MKEKSQVADIDRSIYDIRDEENDAYRMQSGLTPEIIEKLSKEKNDPVWMQQFRLQSLQIYNETPVPDWGPSLEGLDIDNIATYVRPNTKMQNNWENVPRRTVRQRVVNALSIAFHIAGQRRRLSASKCRCSSSAVSLSTAGSS